MEDIEDIAGVVAEGLHDWEDVGLGWTCRKCNRWMNRTQHLFEDIVVAQGRHVELDYYRAYDKCPGDRRRAWIPALQVVVLCHELVDSADYYYAHADSADAQRSYEWCLDEVTDATNHLLGMTEVQKAEFWDWWEERS